MNKIMNISIGGIIFHVDEEAFEKLKKYLEEIKSILINPKAGRRLLVILKGGL